MRFGSVKLQAASIVVSAALCFGSAALAVSPFDQLSADEHWRVIETLGDAGKLDGDTRFGRLSILPPDKSKAWKSGARGPRLAEIMIKQGPKAFEGVVNVDTGKLVSWTEKEGVQPPWLVEEYFGRIPAIVKAHPEFRAALARRGYTRPEFMKCITLPPGNFGEERFAGKRIGVVRCYPDGPLMNTFPRRVEGLLVFADMNTGEIIEIDDYEVVPAVKTIAEYDFASVNEGRRFNTPLNVTQDEGASFSFDGNIVTWDKWRFHIQSDQRVGIVISEASWGDGDNRRPVLYQGYLSEISVPYMAPYGDWYLRNPIDAGEYSAGGLSDPLTKGVHCPAHAKFVDALIVTDRGQPQTKNNVICMFERASGDPSWLHDVQGRQDRTLVARMAARLGNYDYVVDWEFSPDGQIKVRLGATGVVAIKNSVEKNALSKSAADERADAYGRFVDDHVVAINHSHYFSFRLDLDVDGAKNDFRLGKLVQKRLPESSPRKSIWVFEDSVLGNEDEARLGGGHSKPSLWRVASAEKRNGVGYPTSYQIMPGMTAPTLMSEDDYPRLRTGFIDHPLWVTAYDAKERFAAGDYPTLSEPGQGLPAWSKEDDIAATDIVAWYTIGMHHVVRAEDWPVMPVLWHDVTLRPFDFFDGNPAITMEPTTP